MDPQEAREALDQVARRRRQTIDAGSTGWSWRTTACLCASILTLGLLVDVDLAWLWFVAMFSGLGAAWRSSVRLRTTAASTRWRLALAAACAVAFVVYEAVQVPLDTLGWPIPSTLGAVAACLVLLVLIRPVQTRLAASLRP